MMHLLFRRSRTLGLGALGVVLIVLVLGLLLSGRLQAQAAPSHTFMYLIGADTVGLEKVTLNPGVVNGVITMRGQARVEWDQTHENQTPGPLTMRVFAPGAAADATPAQRIVLSARGDSLYIEQTAGGTTRTVARPIAPGTVSLIGNSVIHASLLANYARSAGKATLSVFNAAGGQTMQATITFAGDTSVFTVAGIPIRTSWRDGVPSEITVAAQGLRVVPATSPVAPPSSAPEVIDYSAPSGAPYTAESVTIPTSRGYSLSGTLTKPVGVARAPVVITISGSGPQERDARLPGIRGYAIFRQIADTLGRRGIAVLRYDDRGVGKSGGADSRGRATSADFADDVQSVITFLRARADINGAHIGLAGHSEGGLIAPLVAARDPQVHAIALLAGPVYGGRRILEYQNELAIRAAPGLSDTQRDSLRRTVPGALDSLARTNPWFGYFMQTDPAVALRTLRQPVLVLQGDTDRQISPEQADSIRVLLQSTGNTAVTLRHFDNTNHLFLRDSSGAPGGYAALTDTRVRTDVLGTIADWFVKTLR